MSSVPPETTDSEHKPRRRLWRWILIAMPLVLALTGFVAYRYYTNPQRVRALAEAYLQRYTVGRVEVQSATFSWADGITLYDATITEPPQRGDDVVFHCRRLELSLNTSALIHGGMPVRSILAVEPLCRIVRDQRTGKTNLADLFRLPVDAVSSEKPNLPAVELRNARLHVAQRLPDSERQVAELMLVSMRGTPNPSQPTVYDVSWRDGQVRPASGRSQIDLKTGHVRNLEGGLPWMSIEAVMIAVNTRFNAAGMWSDLLGLDGTVRATNYDFTGTSRPDDLRFATVELSGASISIPLTDAERPLPLDQRYVRFNNVQGFLRITTEDIRVDFSAEFHGADCHVRGLMRGGVAKFESLDDVDFEVDIQIDGLTLPRTTDDAPPAERRFINRWPRLVTFYRNYSPSGLCNLSVSMARKAGVDAPVVVDQVQVDLLGAQATLRWFPYPADNITGEVEYTPNGIFLRNLHGTHDGVDIQLQGVIDKPSFCAPAWLRIAGSNVRLDSELILAMPARYHALLDRFQPDGYADMDVLLTRPACTDRHKAKWDPDAVITLNGAHACFDSFPHPLEAIDGNIIVDGNHVQFQRIVGRLDDAEVHINGEVDFKGRHLDEVSLQVKAQNADLTEHLLAAFPDKVESVLRQYRVAGLFDVVSDLYFSASTGHLNHDTSVTLRDCRVTPPALPIPITGVAGQVDITASRVSLRNVFGQFNEAVVTADGVVCLDDGEENTTISVSADGLHVSETFRNALPEHFQKSLSAWQIEGPIDTSALVMTQPDGKAPTLVEATADIRHGRVQHPRLSRPLEQVSGSMRIGDDIVTFEDIEAAWGTARVRLNASVDLANPTGRAGTIELSAANLPLDEHVRHLLPTEAMPLWDRVKPAGTVDVELMPLSFRPDLTGTSLLWSVQAQTTLRNVALANMADAKNIWGSFDLRGNLVDRTGGISLTGTLNLNRAGVYGHVFENVTGNWVAARTHNGEGGLKVTDLAGTLYEGTVSGEVAVQFTKNKTQYAASATIQQMAVAPFVNAGRSGQSTDKKPMDLTGQATAQFQLEGVFDQPHARQGRGRAVIENGQMYKLPILLMILHVINLSVPQEDAFQTARAEFFVDGDQLRFSHFELHGSALELTGTGTLSIPDRGLDLVLYSVSPRKTPISAVITPISREVLELHVTGSLADPKIQKRFLPGVTEEIRQLFKKREPRQNRE